MSTATPRPQLNPDEMRRLKWLLGGMVALVSLWTVFFLDIEALSLVVITSVVVLTAMIWPQLPAHVPTLVWKLSVPAIIIAVAADFWFSSDTLPALIRLAILLVLYRAISYRRKREDLQLIVLGLFLIVVAGVLTVSPEFAFLLLLFTACALGFLFVVTLIDMTDTGPRVMRPEEMREVPTWARGGWKPFFARLRQVADWRLIGFAAGLFVLVVGFSALLFLVIPRFELGSGFFLDKYITRKSRTGFSETIKFGDVSDLVRDESVAMRVDVTDAVSLRGAPYWRLIVLDQYKPRGFKMSDSLRNKLQASEERNVSVLIGRKKSGAMPASSGGLWTFYVEPEVSRFLPIPGSFGSMRLSNQLSLQYSREQQLIALRTESMAMISFQLEGVVLSPTIADPGFAEQRERRFSKESAKEYNQRSTLRGPEGPVNEAVLHRITGEITNGATLDAAAFADRATDWMRKRHSYSLSSRIPPGPKEMDDIVKWLDSNEPGFCEYFASGMTVLCRAAGYPARVIGGFHGGTLNAFEKYFMVKNSDAHAWSEVFNEKGEWFRVDATPGATNAASAENVTEAVRQKQDSSWTARFDSLRVLWYRRIVNFDARQQVKMLDDVKTFTTESSNALQKYFEALSVRCKTWLAGPWNFARIGHLLQLVAALGLMIWASVRAWYWSRLVWLTWWQPGNHDPVRTEAGRWLGELGRSGAKPVPPGEMVERVRADLLRLRYGPRESWPEPREVFHRARQARRIVRVAKYKATDVSNR